MLESFTIIEKNLFWSYITSNNYNFLGHRNTRKNLFVWYLKICESAIKLKNIEICLFFTH